MVALSALVACGPALGPTEAEPLPDKAAPAATQPAGDEVSASSFYCEGYEGGCVYNCERDRQYCLDSCWNYQDFEDRETCIWYTCQSAYERCERECFQQYC